MGQQTLPVKASGGREVGLFVVDGGKYKGYGSQWPWPCGNKTLFKPETNEEI